MYAIFLATVFNPMESETEMIVTKECTKFDFTCTTVYGCEIAAMGKRTTEKFSKGTKSLFLEQGESTNEYICPGLSEALDIAPRASVKADVFWQPEPTGVNVSWTIALQQTTLAL